MKKNFITFAIPIVIICLGFILPSLSAQDTISIIEVSAKEAATLIDKHNGDSDFAILDIRTPGEFQFGHLSDAILMARLVCRYMSIDWIPAFAGMTL